MNKLEQWWGDFKRLPNHEKIMLGLAVAGVVGLGLYARSKNSQAAGNAGTDSGTGAGSGVGDTGTTTTTGTPPTTVSGSPVFPPSGGGGDSGGGGGFFDGGGGDTGGGAGGGGSPTTSQGVFQERTGKGGLQEANLPPAQSSPLGFPVIASGLQASNIQLVSAGGRRYVAPLTPTPGTVLPVVPNQMPLPKGTSITGQVLPSPSPAPAPNTKILGGGKIAL